MLTSMLKNVNTHKKDDHYDRLQIKQAFI